MELKDPPSSEVDVSRGDALAFNIKGDALELKDAGRRVASPELSQEDLTRGHRGATAEVSQESLTCGQLCQKNLTSEASQKGLAFNKLCQQELTCASVNAREVGHKCATVMMSQENLTREGGLEPFDVFVTSPQLQNELGTGLIDTGAQVSLVRKSSLKKSTPKGKYREINVNIQGINGGEMHITKGIMLQVNDTK
jgi:hypothetical protein